jgi:hypothetical protein
LLGLRREKRRLGWCGSADPLDSRNLREIDSRLEQARQFPQIYLKPHLKSPPEDVLVTPKLTAIGRRPVNSGGIANQTKDNESAI